MVFEWRMHWFDLSDAHLLEAIPRNLFRNLTCESRNVNLLHLEKYLSSSGLSLKKETHYYAPSTHQYLYNGFQFSKWFHRHYLILEAMWCSRKKIRLESGNLNCSLVSSTRCRWPWMRYLTCLGRSLLICNMPVLEQIISRSFQFQNSIIL